MTNEEPLSAEELEEIRRFNANECGLRSRGWEKSEDSKFVSVFDVNISIHVETWSKPGFGTRPRNVAASLQNSVDVRALLAEVDRLRAENAALDARIEQLEANIEANG